MRSVIIELNKGNYQSTKVNERSYRAFKRTLVLCVHRVFKRTQNDAQTHDNRCTNAKMGNVNVSRSVYLLHVHVPRNTAKYNRDLVKLLSVRIELYKHLYTCAFTHIPIISGLTSYLIGVAYVCFTVEDPIVSGSLKRGRVDVIGFNPFTVQRHFLEAFCP